MAKKPPLSGEVARRNAETERLQQICDDLSVTFGDSVPTPFVPSGHFPLIGGIGPWKGSQGARTAGGAAEKGDNLSVSLRLTAPLKGEPWVCVSRKPFFLDFPAHFR